MLRFDLRSLESRAVPVDAVLSADDAVWVDGDVVPSVGVHVTGRLSPAGTASLYFSGRLAGTAAAECRRCLTDVTVPVDEPIQLVFAEEGSEESSDPDVATFDPSQGTLDLAPAVREQWLLAVPSFVVCREDCRGLCPQCGLNRNEGTCTCREADTDPRWAALRALLPESR
jgi:uncharacterized protein